MQRQRLLREMNPIKTYSYKPAKPSRNNYAAQRCLPASFFAVSTTLGIRVMPPTSTSSSIWLALTFESSRHFLTGPTVRANVQLSKATLSLEKGVTLTGIVSGLPQFQDMDLKQFEIALERSPTLRNVTETSKNRITKLGEGVTEFELTAQERK